MKNLFLSSQRSLKIAKYTCLSLIVCGSAFAATVSWLGLDDDSLYSSADAVLETVQTDEELGFKNVAGLIARFVQGQVERRTQELREAANRSSEDERRNVFGDLPVPNYSTRDVHRKSNGCFAAELQIAPNLLDVMNARAAATASKRVAVKSIQDLGVFRPGMTYDAVVRFSNGHPLNRPDNLPDARGFAVKILGAMTLSKGNTIATYSGEELNDRTLLDILNINFPTFFVNEHETAAKYLAINQNFLHGAYDFRNGFFKTKITEGLATFGAGLNAMEMKLALEVNGSIIKSVLFQEYFSMVPSRLGPQGTTTAVKYIWSPVACSKDAQAKFEEAKKAYWPAWAKSHEYADPIHILRASSDERALLKSLAQPRDALRQNVTQLLKDDDACFALLLQPYLDPMSTNIEDSTDIWLRSEAERKFWLETVVPGPRSPYWSIGKQSREAYVQRIESKVVSEPVFAGVLRIKKLTNGVLATGNSKTCEDLSFNPWNGDIAHHKPLGVISRLKRRVYNASRRMRHALNDLHDTERPSK